MPRQIYRHKRQPAFRMRCAQIPTTRHKTHRRSRDRLRLSFLDDEPDGGIIRHEELVALQRAGFESLASVPRHVVQSHERAVRDQQKI